MNSLADAQQILDAFHNGSAKYLGVNRAGHVVVEYPDVTGVNANLSKGIINQPTNVFLIKGTVSPSIVPTNPYWKP